MNMATLSPPVLNDDYLTQEECDLRLRTPAYQPLAGIHAPVQPPQRGRAQHHRARYEKIPNKTPEPTPNDAPKPTELDLGTNNEADFAPPYNNGHESNNSGTKSMADRWTIEEQSLFDKRHLNRRNILRRSQQKRQRDRNPMEAKGELALPERQFTIHRR
jgi:hypothetical protein